MDRPRLLRLLRIATASASLLVCAAFVVLWYRSFSWMDDIQYYGVGDKAIRVVSRDGQLVLGMHPLPKHLAHTGWLSSQDAKLKLTVPRFMGFGVGIRRQGPTLVFPTWFPVLISGLIAATIGIPFKWRFSIRSMLLFLTFLTLLLGATVYAIR